MFAPRELRGADVTIAAEMATGLYVFDGREVEIGRGSPFAVPPPSPGWAQEIFAFGWLRHFRAAGTAQADAEARRLVALFLGCRRRDLDGGVVLDPSVTMRRLVSLLAQAPTLLEGADASFERKLMRRIGKDAWTLGRAAVGASRPKLRLDAAIGLCFAGLCCLGLGKAFRRGPRVLARELDAQIAADGCHLDRNPDTLLQLLLDLIPLRLLFDARGVRPPAILDLAIGRMSAALRRLRHGSGELALFNGMGSTATGELATVLSLDGQQAPGSAGAEMGGYARLEAGTVVVVMDAGPAPPPAASSKAHAGALSFELSSGPDRIVVNRGAADMAGPAREAARATFAHSTLTIGELSSALVLAPLPAKNRGWAASYLARRLGPALIGRPARLTVDLETGTESGVVASASHDGFLPVRAVHERRLTLELSGAALLGEDTLVWPERGAELAALAMLRFHLHPSAQADPAEEGAILIRTRSGERWRFASEGEPPRLEPSVFNASGAGRSTTIQIVVPLRRDPGSSRAKARWSFRREGGP